MTAPSPRLTQSKIAKVFHLLRRVPLDKRPNLALLNESEFLFSYKNRLSMSSYMIGFGPIGNLRPERGPIMDFFTQIEIIVNQIFVVHLIEKGRVENLEQLLDHVDLFSKVKLMKKWSLITKDVANLTQSLKEVRNSFAHQWQIEGLKYGNKDLAENFEVFKRDLEVVFSELVKLYNGREINIDALIMELESLAAST